MAELELAEVWTDVVGSDGTYKVSTFGNVGSYLNGRFRLLKSHKAGSHLRAGVKRDGKYKHCSIHRLVAEAFLPRPENGLIVNHKDNDPHNNRLDNLEWLDCSGNARHALRAEKKRANPYRAAYDALMAVYPLGLENLDGEEWRDIEGYDGDYQESSHGRTKVLREESRESSNRFLAIPGIFTSRSTMSTAGTGVKFTASLPKLLS